MEVTAKNRRIINAVIARIEKFPKAYRQDKWGARISKSIAPCGTAACIAGEICLVTNVPPIAVRRNCIESEEVLDTHVKQQLVDNYYLEDDSSVDVMDYAKTALGLTNEEAEILFDGMPSACWPSPFDDKWYEAGKSREAQAAVAIEYLKYIRRTGDVLCERHPKA